MQWDLTLTATLDNSHTFTDTQPVLVELAAITPVTFTLKTTSDEGGFALRVDFTGSAAAATYKLYKYSDNSLVDSGNLTINAGNYVQYERDAQTNPLVEGTYRIQIDFYGDTGNPTPQVYLNTYSEIVRVKGGFTSRPQASRTIDLNGIYHLQFHTNVISGGSEVPAADLLKSGEHLVELFSLHSGTIALPEPGKGGLNAYWLFTHIPYHARVIILVQA